MYSSRTSPRPRPPRLRPRRLPPPPLPPPPPSSSSSPSSIASGSCPFISLSTLSIPRRASSPVRPSPARRGIPRAPPPASSPPTRRPTRTAPRFARARPPRPPASRCALSTRSASPLPLRRLASADAPRAPTPPRVVGFYSQRPLVRRRRARVHRRSRAAAAAGRPDAPPRPAYTSPSRACALASFGAIARASFAALRASFSRPG